MRTIHCSKCHLDLPIESFRMNRITDGTKTDQCRKCRAQLARAWNVAHPDRVAKSEKRRKPRADKVSAWQKANRQHLTGYMIGWRNANRDKVRAIAKKSRVKNKEKVAAIKAERNARMRSRMPAWADREAIKAFYVEARRLYRETGIKYHVDHIIPLNGRNVCGLHIETNLQIIPSVENLRKGRTFMEA